MGARTGTASLPLHGGRVPSWLASRMARLGRVMVEAIVLQWGRDGLLERLSHPFWFQSLGAVMGMDWHSSGITTSVLGALKRGLEPVSEELGLYVCGGRGRHSRNTPAELLEVGTRTGLDGAALARASRLVAKVDSCAVQDGFELYLHGMVVSREGEWVVVQQGMNTEVRTARRYHWRSAGLRDFTDAPHSAIEGRAVGEILNLTDHRARAARTAQVHLVEGGPDAVIEVVRRLEGRPSSAQGVLPNLVLPAHHEVTPSDVVLRRLHGAIAAAHERGPTDFAELLLTPGLGARTVRALALVAEVVHGTPSRFTDPARFSFALGGKDGHPFPVPLAVYDQTITVLRQAVAAAKLGQDEKLAAFRVLDAESRRLEAGGGPSFSALVEADWRHSVEWKGRTAMGPAGERAARPPTSSARPPARIERGQLALGL